MIIEYYFHLKLNISNINILKGTQAIIYHTIIFMNILQF